MSVVGINEWKPPRKAGERVNRLARDETAEPVSRDRIFRRERGQGNITFLFELTTSKIGNLTWLIIIFLLRGRPFTLD